MAYSGTVGTTVIQVQTLIDHGARRCGKLAEELTSEQVLSARESLFFLLSNLINIGIQYWAIKKEVIGLTADKYIYTLPDGSNDVLNALYRTMNRPSGSYTTSAGGTVSNVADNDIDTYCQQTSANGNISVNFGTDNPVYAGSIGLMPALAGSAAGAIGLMQQWVGAIGGYSVGWVSHHDATNLGLLMAVFATTSVLAQGRLNRLARHHV